MERQENMLIKWKLSEKLNGSYMTDASYCYYFIRGNERNFIHVIWSFLFVNLIKISQVKS